MDALTFIPPGIRFLFPGWIVPWFAVAASVCLILGRKRLALVFASVPVGRWIVAPLLRDFVASLPGWVLPALGAAVLLLVMIIGPKRLVRLAWGKLFGMRRQGNLRI